MKIAIGLPTTIPGLDHGQASRGHAGIDAKHAAIEHLFSLVAGSDGSRILG